MIAVTSERLEHLRMFAKLERDTILEHMMRDGRDPAEAVAEVPGVDEFVVTALRDEMLEDRGRLAEYSMTRLAARGSGPDAAEHRRNADRAEFALLREIAEQVPELTAAVWRLSGSLDVDAEA